jgi:CBS domain-containing protein
MTKHAEKPRGGRARHSGGPANRSGPARKPPVLRVRDLMKPTVVSISPDASIEELIRLLRDHDIGGVPVVDETGRAIGLVSSTDLLWLADAAAGADVQAGPFLPLGALDNRTVRDIMTPDVFGVEPDATLAALRRFFARTGVHRALVLDDGRIEGIVALSDVLNTMVP